MSHRGREPITTTLGNRNLRNRERKTITPGRERKITTPGRDRLDRALRTTHLRPAAQQYRGQERLGTMLGQMQLRAPELQTISQAADRWLLDRGPRITIPHLGSLRRTTARAVVFRVRLLGDRTSRKDGRAMQRRRIDPIHRALDRSLRGLKPRVLCQKSQLGHKAGRRSLLLRITGGSLHR